VINEYNLSKAKRGLSFSKEFVESMSFLLFEKTVVN